MSDKPPEGHGRTTKPPAVPPGRLEEGEHAFESITRLREATTSEQEGIRKNGVHLQEFDLLNPVDRKVVMNMLGDVAEHDGADDVAVRLRGKPLDKSVKGRILRLSGRKISYGGVATLVTVGTAVWLLWEGIAYLMDWNFRVGVFGEKNSEHMDTLMPESEFAQ